MAAGVERMHNEHFEAACAAKQQEERTKHDLDGSSQPWLPCPTTGLASFLWCRCRCQVPGAGPRAALLGDRHSQRYYKPAIKNIKPH